MIFNYVFGDVFEDYIIIVDGDSFIVMFEEIYLSIQGVDVFCYLYYYDQYNWLDLYGCYKDYCCNY